jgi:hypothetical protein
MRSHRAIAAAALLLPLLSCGDSTAPPKAATIELTLTELAFDALGLAVPVFAVVKDDEGNVLSSVTPTWSTNAAGVATVNAAGTVTAAGNGAATITAAAGSAQATVSVTVDQAPIAFGLATGANGDGLSAIRGLPVTVRPAVRVLDGNGRGVANETVTFTVLSGGGSAPVAAAQTDVNGVARVASWTLGPDVGPNTLEASYGGFTPVVFTVTGIDDPCTAAGAETLTLGVGDNGTLAAGDCLASSRYYDLYRIVLDAPSAVVIELSSPIPPDPYLVLLASDNSTLIAENDDIIGGVIRDARIGIELAAGTYYVRASSWYSAETGSYSILARVGIVGAPAAIIATAGQGQVSAPNAPTPVLPSVKVVDDLGDPVPNVAVTFATVTGIGSATGLDAMTNAEGIATVGSWTLAAGANVLTATVAGGGIVANPMIFSAMGNANPAAYNISLRFQDVPTQGQLQAFSDAVLRWEAIITGDVPSIALPLDIYCPDAPVLDETIDDLLIYVQLRPIDGSGQVLGSAGPCFIRDPSFLPIVGVMKFDIADIDGGDFPAVILHEMAHVLGFGTIWQFKNLLVNPSLSPGSPGADTHFPGPQAIAAFNAAGGSSYVGGKVPVENTQGGIGTRDAHWREGRLVHELMTGFLTGSSQPLSAITIRSMQDLGYTVSTATADPYTFIPPIRAGAPGTERSIHLVRDLLDFPPRVFDPSQHRVKKQKPGVR